MKRLFLLLLLAALTNTATAQLGNLLNRAKQKANDKVNQKIDQKLDKAADKVVNGADDAVSGKSAPDKPNTGSNNPAAGGNDEGGAVGKGSTPTLKAYSKFDFVPGEKIIAQEDFSQDNVGDFPDKWNTNASGEIRTIEGVPGKWLALTKPGVYYPEFINALPENFTVEFDAASSSNYSFYSAWLLTGIARAGDAKSIFSAWKAFGHGRDGIGMGIHPQNAGSSKNAGIYSYKVYEKGEETMKSEGGQSNFTNTRKVAHIAIWRQKTRIRMYINQEKVIDLPRALNGTYNKIVFAPDYSYHNENDVLYISNLRVAVGAPDTRNKLITEGKFVTRGILFDVNSANIKPESYGAVKDIATVLQENAEVKVKIVGHTDSDGDDKTNLDLSRKRAEAVKNLLTKEFGITAERMEADGKGESQPADKNTSSEGKANNRRVEFIRL
jgi:OmpA-OmpF porin, OOP family